MRYQGGQVRLVDLCDAAGKIQGLEAEGVTFTGPAIMVADGCTINGCSWDGAGGGPEAVVWEIDPARASVVGAVHVISSTFQDCKFVNVGFAGMPDAVQTFFEATTV